MKITHILIALALALPACSAGGSSRADAPAGQASAQRNAADAFCADSAYAFVAEQVAMGPRTPGSEASRRCADWIAGRLRAAGADSVAFSDAAARRFDGVELPLRNVFARFGGGASKRVLLLAHYDTRPWADMETDPELRMKPIPGANDGASGVGVLLEIARVIGRERPGVGVDMLFVDGEDSGYSAAVAPDGVGETPDTWCLGTQAWVAENPYRGETSPAYAVLLDIVGGAGARFHREYFSDMSASRMVSRIWGEAAALGHADIFVDAPGGAVVDDHIYLSRAGIPAVDIIESVNAATGTFPPYWHTHSDNMDNIDPATLSAVGRTVLNLIYKEK